MLAAAGRGIVLIAPRSNMDAELNLEALREGVKGIEYGTAELHLEAMSAFILRQIERVERGQKYLDCEEDELRADLLKLQREVLG